MRRVDFSDEAKFYFLDNGDYVFDLLVQIEALKYRPDNMPPEGLTSIGDPDRPNLYLWEVLNHAVYLNREPDRILIAAVKPIAFDEF